MVTRIIEERVDDGQFDECDLTLRDLERIREAFVGQLLGMYHTRIAYPQNRSWSWSRVGRRAEAAAGLVTAAVSRGGDPAVTRAIYLAPWRVDVTVRDGVVAAGLDGAAGARDRWPPPCEPPAPRRRPRSA